MKTMLKMRRPSCSADDRGTVARCVRSRRLRFRSSTYISPAPSSRPPSAMRRQIADGMRGGWLVAGEMCCAGLGGTEALAAAAVASQISLTASPYADCYSPGCV